MFQLIKDNLLLPLLGRGGTAIATVLVGYGVHADLAGQLAVGFTAAGLVAFDLAVSYFNRKRTSAKAVRAAVLSPGTVFNDPASGGSYRVVE